MFRFLSFSRMEVGTSSQTPVSIRQESGEYDRVSLITAPTECLMVPRTPDMLGFPSPRDERVVQHEDIGYQTRNVKMMVNHIPEHGQKAHHRRATPQKI